MAGNIPFLTTSFEFSVWFNRKLLGDIRNLVTNIALDSLFVCFFVCLFVLLLSKGKSSISVIVVIC